MGMMIVVDMNQDRLYLEDMNNANATAGDIIDYARKGWVLTGLLAAVTFDAELGECLLVINSETKERHHVLRRDVFSVVG